jgi:hypothetical protein
MKQPRYTRPIGHIDRMCQKRLLPLILPRRLAELILPSPGNRDPAAFIGERDGDAIADSRGSAGDENAFVGEVHDMLAASLATS